MDGPAQICFGDKQLPQQGTGHHPEGFSSPIGLSEGELKKFQLKKGEITKIDWPCGIQLSARVENFVYADDKLVVITFSDCTMTHGSKVLYKPEWGSFDMIVGKKVVSVFSGPADRKAYGFTETFVKKVIPRRQWSAKELELQKIYENIRKLRNTKASESSLKDLVSQLDKSFPEEWLAYLEILEMVHSLKLQGSLKQYINEQLVKIKQSDSHKKEYIDLGLELVDKVI